MQITPEEARKKLVSICKLAWFAGHRPDPNAISLLHKFIDEVEGAKPQQTAALFKPPVKTE